MKQTTASTAGNILSLTGYAQLISIMNLLE